MRIAFYAPMKPPDHPVPSGDRRMAGLLMAALRRAGHQPVLASRLRTWTGDEGMAGAASRAVLRLKSAEQAAALVRRWRDAADRPDLWFTYHLFHKAPDGIGPVVARELAIPYVVAEASVAPKRRTGPWAAGHAAVVAALGQAAAVIALNPADRACVLPCLADGRRLYDLPPFLDARPYVAARRRRAAGRARLATAHALDPATPWLIAVAMMRPGDKLASWRLLAKALLPLATPAAQAPAWHLLAVGDGPAGEAVRRLFRPLARHMVWLGQQPEDALPDLYAASDLCVWPAINEAWGMALLEAQASGVPVLAGDAGGVPAVVHDGATGRLVPVGDAAAFAHALRHLLQDSDERARLAAGARRLTGRRHGLAGAARRLDHILARALVRASARTPRGMGR